MYEKEFINITAYGNIVNKVLYVESYFIRVKTYEKIKQFIYDIKREIDLSYNMGFPNMKLKIFVEKSDYQDTQHMSYEYGQYQVGNLKGILLKELVNIFKQNNLNLMQEFVIVESILKCKYSMLIG